MTDPKALWAAALDCLSTMPGVQGATKDYPANGNTAASLVDKAGTVVHDETGKQIGLAVVINDRYDLAERLASLVADFRVHLTAAGLPPDAYIRGTGTADEEVFSSPLIIDGVPARIMALTHRVRSRWLVILDTYTRLAGNPVKKSSRKKD